MVGLSGTFRADTMEGGMPGGAVPTGGRPGTGGGASFWMASPMSVSTFLNEELTTFEDWTKS
jgi:hypothetical protein